MDSIFYFYSHWPGLPRRRGVLAANRNWKSRLRQKVVPPQKPFLTQLLTIKTQIFLNYKLKIRGYYTNICWILGVFSHLKKVFMYQLGNVSRFLRHPRSFFSTKSLLLQHVRHSRAKVNSHFLTIFPPFLNNSDSKSQIYIGPRLKLPNFP
jgi:hypothetical protein